MRLIDADALREKWICLIGDDFKASDFVYAVDIAPTVGAVPVMWIPCSERLPEENMWTICQNNAGAMMIGKYDIEFGWMFPAYFDGIIAWMPLPKPYVEETAKQGETE